MSDTKMLVSKCPLSYVGQSPELPPSCAEFCPIARGAMTIEQGREQSFYSVNDAAKNPQSPLFGRYNGRTFTAQVRIINNTAHGRKRILTVSKDSQNPNAAGYGKRVIPHCAAQAYCNFVDYHKARNLAIQQERAERRERRKRGETIKRNTIRPRRELERALIVEIIDATSTAPVAEKVRNALRGEIAREVIAAAQGGQYVRAPMAAIGRKYDRTKQRVSKIAQTEGLNYHAGKKRKK